MHILVAPDKFKGTLTAGQAAQAIATGWMMSRPEDRIALAPMADGGEGTMEALLGAMAGRTVLRQVRGPLGDRIEAAFGLAETADGVLGIVEMSRASGLELLDPSRRRPLETSTAGTGDLMIGAIESGATKLLVCLGGSATNDGGAGMASAFGYRLLDASGAQVAPGGRGLVRLGRIDASGVRPALAKVAVTGACDVDNPLTGPSGASAVYGPQKGASADEVVMLDRALGHLAAVVHRDLGVELRAEPGAGAAGGLGFGLMAFCGARLRPGVQVVMEALDLPARIAEADLVITGEGSLDAQSLHGKTPAGVMAACELAGVPVAILCGRASIEPPGIRVFSAADRAGERAAMEDARGSLIALAAEAGERVKDIVGTGA
jgi:glycerate kinase